MATIPQPASRRAHYSLIPSDSIEEPERRTPIATYSADFGNMGAPIFFVGAAGDEDTGIRTRDCLKFQGGQSMGHWTSEAGHLILDFLAARGKWEDDGEAWDVREEA